MTRRFYTSAAAVRLEDGGVYGVALDGRPVRTPAGARLAVPAAALAEAIAREWAAQESEIRPLDMPLMRLAATAIDRVGAAREELVERMAAYGGSDLLCYRASGPRELARRQAELWQPLLDWAAEVHGARLKATEGVVPVRQEEAALAALRAAVERHDDFRLAALSQLTAACGSLVLALAVCGRRIGAAEATAASQLDEDWQAQLWGEDREALERRRALAGEIAAAVEFLDLLDA